MQWIRAWISSRADCLNSPFSSLPFSIYFSIYFLILSTHTAIRPHFWPKTSLGVVCAPFHFRFAVQSVNHPMMLLELCFLLSSIAPESNQTEVHSIICAVPNKPEKNKVMCDTFPQFRHKQVLARVWILDPSGRRIQKDSVDKRREKCSSPTSISMPIISKGHKMDNDDKEASSNPNCEGEGKLACHSALNPWSWSPCCTLHFAYQYPKSYD